MKNKITIKHIGNVLAKCNKNISANLREDLELKRYKQLGIKERFKDEKPYRICKNCLAKIFQQEHRYDKKYSHRKWNFYNKNF